MNPLAKTLAALAAKLGIYAADGLHLRALAPGRSTRNEIRERLGEPAAEWPNADGSTTLEYPRGPEGIECWMLTVDAHGVYRHAAQALNEDNFARIERGWAPNRVRRLLGRPANETRFPLKSEIVWEWRTAARASGDRAWFHVHFSARGDEPGEVTGTSRREETLG